MSKETKYVIGTFLVLAVIIVGVAVLASKPTSGSTTNVGGDRFINSVPAEGINAAPESIDIGKVSYGGGIISKEYQIKNTTGSSMKLRKIVTSCMCTKARVKFENKTTKLYAMEMNGDKNPIIDYDFPAGSTATVEFNFDPAAHGPAGIGPVERVITLYFDTGYKELKFNGEVVK
jgi:hypothetical protein